MEGFLSKGFGDTGGMHGKKYALVKEYPSGKTCFNKSKSFNISALCASLSKGIYLYHCLSTIIWLAQFKQCSGLKICRNIQTGRKIPSLETIDMRLLDQECHEKHRKTNIEKKNKALAKQKFLTNILIF